MDDEATDVAAPPMLAAVRAAAIKAPAAIMHDPRAEMRAALKEELEPTLRALAQLQRRVDELERLPQPTPGAYATRAYAQAGSRPPSVSSPSFDAPLPRAPAMSIPILDIKAIERDVTIIVDDAIDGRARKRRLVVIFVLFLVLLFGGLGYLVARSYLPSTAG